jgi:hypothetical protein
MKSIHLLILAGLFFHQIAQGALPPAAEGLRRIKAIADTEAVYDKIGSAHWIRGIIQQNETDYVVQTDTCTLYVKVEAVHDKSQKPKMVGPEPLQVKVGQLQCNQ